MIILHLPPADSLVFPFLNPAKRLVEVKGDFNRVTLARSLVKGELAEAFHASLHSSVRFTFQKVFPEMTR